MGRLLQLLEELVLVLLRGIELRIHASMSDLMMGHEVGYLPEAFGFQSDLPWLIVVV